MIFNNILLNFCLLILGLQISFVLIYLRKMFVLSLQWKQSNISYNNKTILIFKKHIKTKYNLFNNIFIEKLIPKNFIIILILQLFILYFCLTIFLETNDQFNIVFNFSNINQPFFYKFCSFWSFHEGSLFLWNLLLLFLNSIFLFSKIFLKKSYQSLWLILILNLSTFFWQLLLFTSNPFLRYENFYEKNIDLNPILQDIILSIHPPLLYIGYVGSSSIFILALVYWKFLKKKSVTFIFLVIKYLNVFVWQFLTIGILLGSWWAYNELGWGGWWFWDPVENISLIPWIFSLILLHLNYLNNKIKWYSYIYYLSFLIFFINVLGTCFVRAGFLNSVHMFASDNLRGFFLFFVGLQLFFYISFYLKKNFKILNQNLNYNILEIICLIFLIISLLSNVFIIFGTFFLDFFFEKNFISPTMYNELLYPFVFLLDIFLIFFIFKKWYINQISILYFIFFTFFSIIIILNTFFSIKDYLILILFKILLLGLIWKIPKNFKVLRYYVFHIIIQIFLTIILIQSYFSYEFLKILVPGDKIIFEYFELIFNKPFFLETSLYNSNITNFLISNLYNNNFSWAFIEKRFYYIKDIFVMKHNIYSNFLCDFQIFLNSGNIFNGWLFKIKQVFFINFLWLFGLLFYIGLIIYSFFIYNIFKIKKNLHFKKIKI